MTEAHLEAEGAGINRAALKTVIARIKRDSGDRLSFVEAALILEMLIGDELREVRTRNGRGGAKPVSTYEKLDDIFAAIDNAQRTPNRVWFNAVRAHIRAFLREEMQVDLALYDAHRKSLDTRSETGGT